MKGWMLNFILCIMEENKQEFSKRNFTKWNLVLVFFIVLLLGLTVFFVAHEFVYVQEGDELREEVDSFVRSVRMELLMDEVPVSAVQEDSVMIDSLRAK